MVVATALVAARAELAVVIEVVAIVVLAIAIEVAVVVVVGAGAGAGAMSAFVHAVALVLHRGILGDFSIFPVVRSSLANISRGSGGGPDIVVDAL